MKRTTRTTIGDRTRMRLEELETREVPAVVGALDPTFGTAGKVLVNGGPYSAVAVQPDGKIVAVGASTNDFLVVRFNPNGTVDTTFGTGGIQKIDFNGLADAANDVKIQSDGKIVVVGQAATAAHGLDFAIARLNNDGGLDASFGTGGKTTVDFAGGGTNNDVANAVAIAANGNIYVVGTAAGGAGITKFGVAAFSTTGAPLTTFGAAGHEFEDFGGTADAGNGIAIQADGKLVIAGTTNAVPANGTDIAVGRLNPTDGSLDMGFGSSGKVAVNFGGAANDVGNAVAIQPNGDIVVAGASDLNAAGNFDAAAIRLTPTAGALDATFGSGGKATIDFGGNADSANAVVVQPDGNIVIAGNNNADVVVARLLQGNGALDTSFNTTGKVTVDFAGVDSGNGVAVLPTGRIVVTGTTDAGVNGFVGRLIGTVEDGQRLAVSGATNGTAQVFAPTVPTGQYPTTATATTPTVGGFNTGNVRTAVGDVNGDGIPDTIVVTGPGTAIRVEVISGVDNTTLLVQPFDPFGGDFTGGGFVAAGDVDGDGRSEFIVTPDQGGGPRVTIFKLNSDGTTSTLANFFGIDDPSFRGGARAALGDVNGDGVKDLAVAAGFLGGPRVALFDGKTLLTTPTRLVNDFFAFPGTDSTTLRNGVFVSIGDVNGDGFGDLIFGGGPGGAPRVFILSGAMVAANNVAGAQTSPIANFFVNGNSTDRGGVRVAATDADGDNKADLAVGSGEGSPSQVRVYLGKNFTGATEPTTVQSFDPFSTTLAGGVFVG